MAYFLKLAQQKNSHKVRVRIFYTEKVLGNSN